MMSEENDWPHHVAPASEDVWTSCDSCIASTRLDVELGVGLAVLCRREVLRAERREDCSEGLQGYDS